jgi:hypothetical protein
MNYAIVTTPLQATGFVLVVYIATAVISALIAGMIYLVVRIIGRGQAEKPPAVKGKPEEWEYKEKV